MPTFSGETKDGAPIIGARYWKKGVTLTGVVLNAFETANGKCYQLSLMDDIVVPGDFVFPKQKGNLKGKEFAVGALKGFEMAIRSSGASELKERDLVKIECIGETPSGKGSPRIDFKITVTRK